MFWLVMALEVLCGLCVAIVLRARTSRGDMLSLTFKWTTTTQLFDPNSRRNGTVLIHKQPDNIWRIDYQLFDDEITEDALQERTVRSSVDAVLIDIGYTGAYELEWWSVYSANTLALDEYRDGPIFFVGDSAHIVPIFGVRGLNNGLADAANIGWKLAWVLNGKAGSVLLDSYSPERLGATLDEFANASKSARFMTPNTHGWRIMRDAALSLALTHPYAGELANPRQMTPYIYANSPAVVTCENKTNNSPSVGAVAPDIMLDSSYLSDRLRDKFVVLCFENALVSNLNEAFSTIKSVEVITAPYPSKIADAYGAKQTAAYLIRPDLHIAGRWFNVEAQTVLTSYQAVTFQNGVAT